ncbi:MAG: hypothetical protein ABFQ65_00675 [Nanoarchaeota archaeon]
MVNESILGGLRIAIAHKSSLKDAMQSFYNAGYDKKEIEEATQIVFNEQRGKPVESKQVVEKSQTLEKKYQAKPLKPKTVQATKSLKKNIGLIILLIGILIILFGILFGLFIFKDKIF